jgi:hypothetical protein
MESNKRLSPSTYVIIYLDEKARKEFLSYYCNICSHILSGFDLSDLEACEIACETYKIYIIILTVPYRNKCSSSDCGYDSTR